MVDAVIKITSVAASIGWSDPKLARLQYTGARDTVNFRLPVVA
jgi:hypothetical protein